MPDAFNVTHPILRLRFLGVSLFTVLFFLAGNVAVALVQLSSELIRANPEYVDWIIHSSIFMDVLLIAAGNIFPKSWEFLFGVKFG